MSKCRLITFDSETYRTRVPSIVERIMREAREKRPAQNVAKEKTAVWDTEEEINFRMSEALAKTAVDPLLTEILCVSWMADVEKFAVSAMVDTDGHPADGGTSLRSAEEVERLALEEMTRAMDEQSDENTIWCGHNVVNFDIPIMLNRCRRYGIRPPEHFPRYIDGRVRGRVFDTMKRTPCANGLGFVGLDDVCEALGIEQPKPVMWKGQAMHGGLVGAAFEDGAFDTILEYCGNDLQPCFDIYMRYTCDDTWGTYADNEEVRTAIEAIDAGAWATEGEKALAKLKVYEQAGVIRGRYRWREGKDEV